MVAPLLPGSLFQILTHIASLCATHACISAQLGLDPADDDIPFISTVTTMSSISTQCMFFVQISEWTRCPLVPPDC